MSSGTDAQPSPFWPWLESGALALAIVFLLLLAFSNLAVPSLWHDELVHVYVAKNIAEHGWPALPSGQFYPSSLAYNVLLGGVVALFGDGPMAVRSPSVLLSALNVLLLYLLARRLVGRPAALVAAFALALSPWQVAWAREARFYSLQATAYLLVLWATWQAFQAPSPRVAARWAAAAVVAYTLGMLTSYHSILFLGTVGGYAILMGLSEKRLRSRWTVAAVVCTVLGLLTIASLFCIPNRADQAAVFSTGLGGRIPDPQRNVRLYYPRWLIENLSTGFFLLAVLGTGLLPWKERRRGLYVALAFWVPVLVLTFLIGYRRPRFMFFAFPLYTLLCAYALVQLAQWAGLYRRSRWHAVAAAGILVFGLRLGLSAARLTGDSIEAAGGAHVTLAQRHPQWQKPCAYVRAQAEGHSILATTFLPVYHYAGRVDNWFPNRYTRWEEQESGMAGLASLDELQAFLLVHPKGFFLAESARWEMYAGHSQLTDLKAEVQWVEAHMRRIPEACSADVTVYAWNFKSGGIQSGLEWPVIPKFNLKGEEKLVDKLNRTLGVMSNELP